MRIQILAEGDEQAAADLQSWLGRDPATSKLLVEPVVGTGPTMGVLEALSVLLQDGTSLGSFAVAYVTWRGTRAARPDAGARILVHEGTSVDISHLSPEELADLLRRLDGDAPPADPHA